MQNTARLQLAGKSDIDKALAIDAPVLSSTKKDFITANYLNYYVVINTWLMIISQYSAYGWTRLLALITQDGLVSLIKRASDAADELVNTGSINGGIFAGIYRDVLTVLGSTVITPQCGVKSINQNPVATMLMILRYPKRLSPIGNDLIQQKSINDFMNVENRSKMWSRTGYSSYFTRIMREEMSQLLPWDRCCNELEDAINNRYLLDFTSGSSFNTNASLGAKLVELSKTYPEYFRSPFGIPYSGAFPESQPESWGHGEDVRQVKVMAVPKSYKASRIIAPEEVYRQGKAHVAFTIIDRYLPSNISIHDQSVNQDLCYWGSLHVWDEGDPDSSESLATIDLSNASDTITKLLFWEIFPKQFAHMIYPLLPTHYWVGDKWRLMHQMSTAGNSLTFVLESLVFCALAKTATRLYETFSGVDTIRTVEVNGRAHSVPSVYGDDIVVDCRACETLLDVSKALGFIINEAKSYWVGSYRESCGAEFICGIDISSYYFPRFPLDTDQGKIAIRYRRDSFTGEIADSLTSLVSLQHRLFGVCFNASNFLRVLIEESFPGMTTSLWDSPLGDCWDYEDTYKVRYSPTSKDISPEMKKQLPMGAGIRRIKFLPGVRFTLGKDKIPAKSLRLFELHKYNEFLRRGPRYEDPVLELLGISSPPLKVEEAFGKPSITWSYREVEYEF